MGYTHPDILEAERFGGEWNCGAGECEVKFIGACAWCGKNIYDDYEYAVDEDENVFCDQYEAMDFHGIKEVG